jgi:hypothetical protein
MPNYRWSADIRNHTTGTDNGRGLGAVTANSPEEAKRLVAEFVRAKGREQGQTVTPHNVQIYPG